MKIKELRNIISRVRAKYALGALGMSFAMMGTLAYYKNNLSCETKQLSQEVLNRKRQVIREQETTALVKTHEAEFSAFEACRFDQPLTSKELRDSHPHSLEFGSTSRLNHYSAHSELTAQEVSFSLICLRDREIFAHLDQLTTRGPGLFLLKDVVIKRVGPLNEEMLEKIASGKSQALFEGRITTTWIHR
jgi:hypothetical protein